MALSGALTGMVLWYAADLGSRPAQVVGAWVFIAAIHVSLIAAARAMSRTGGLSDAARRFWRAVALGGLIYLVGDLAQVIVAGRDPLAPAAATGGAVQLGALSLGSAWLGLALLMSPLGFGSCKQRIRFWLDVATVMVAAVVVGWYVIVPNRPSAPLDAAAPVLAGPVVLLLCVFVVAKLALSGTAPFTRWTAVLGIVASAAKTSADGIGSGGLLGGRLHWFLAATVASHALLAIAVRVNTVQVADDPEVLRVRRRPYSLLPYGAVAVTYALLAVAVLRHDDSTVRITLAAAAVSTALVIVRQLAAFRENAHLLDELDSKIKELHLTQNGLRASLAERDELAARLRHQAFHDGLTGLPNRVLYTERLDALLASADPRHPVTVMLIDLDDFKLVNDAYGHAAGDVLLRTVADRLRACVRAGDTVARIGGDEFAVLLEPAPGNDATGIAARIAAAVQAPVPVDGGTAKVGASVGVAFSGNGEGNGNGNGNGEGNGNGNGDGDGDGDGEGEGNDDGGDVRLSAEGLLRAADHAMYAVKRAGKGTVASYDHE